MEQRVKPEAQFSLPADLAFLKSKLHLVDLAGSERVNETKATVRALPRPSEFPWIPQS